MHLLDLYGEWSVTPLDPDRTCRGDMQIGPVFITLISVSYCQIGTGEINKRKKAKMEKKKKKKNGKNGRK